MAMRMILLLIGLCTLLPNYAQEFSWSMKNFHPIKNVDAWDVDPMGKVIYSVNDVLIKLDSNFAVLFKQSVKGTGVINEIDARHALKTLAFSEEQQMVFFLDNTLTPHQNSKDLSVINSAYVTKVSYSAQSSRYWAYDGDNSKLIMVDEQRAQPTTIENLAGILGTIEVNQLMEIENMLLVFDASKGVYLFDYYGSMVDFIEVTGAENVHFSRGDLYYLANDVITQVNLRSRKMVDLPLPISGVHRFRILGNYIYLESPDGIRKYLLKREE
jgi:hypothetical protein